MKLHRVFIAVDLPEGVKAELLRYKESWPEVPARWVNKDNLHLTLAFLGNRSDEELVEISQSMLAVGKRHNPFLLQVTRIVYGPDSKKPKMIWALLGKTPELTKLQKDVETTLGHQDGKPFSPHLTLARLNMTAFHSMEAEEIPQIAEDISASFEVRSVEVMESELKRSGAQYTVCQSVSLVV
jgi:RNA 2',3'-cyclic 3'-phosphodiesterase